MNLTCAIVDDEPLALDLLESYVNKTPFLTLKGKYSSAVQAMKELPDKQVDLLFLDIQMPELNGLEFSKMVDTHTRIVFSTAFEQYAIDGYKVNALDYLLKPISYVDFLQAANNPTFATACFIWVVFFPHSCHKPSPPINGIAPKRPCKYPLRMFSPFLGEKDASEYSSVAQDRSSFSANQI